MLGATFRQTLINDYVLTTSFDRKYSTPTTNMLVNAVKMYYVHVLKQSPNVTKILRPHKENTLPKVLSKDEVFKITENTNNLKHRTMHCLLYASGLRAGEIFNLKVTDLDSERMLIHIGQGKEAKDRTTLLPASLLAIFREYYKDYKPKKWMFEGQ